MFLVCSSRRWSGRARAASCSRPTTGGAAARGELPRGRRADGDRASHRQQALEVAAPSACSSSVDGRGAGEGHRADAPRVDPGAAGGDIQARALGAVGLDLGRPRRRAASGPAAMVGSARELAGKRTSRRGRTARTARRRRRRAPRRFASCGHQVHRPAALAQHLRGRLPDGGDAHTGRRAPAAARAPPPRRDGWQRRSSRRTPTCASARPRAPGSPGSTLTAGHSSTRARGSQLAAQRAVARLRARDHDGRWSAPSLMAPPPRARRARGDERARRRVRAARPRRARPSAAASAAVAGAAAVAVSTDSPPSSAHTVASRRSALAVHCRPVRRAAPGSRPRCGAAARARRSQRAAPRGHRARRASRASPHRRRAHTRRSRPATPPAENPPAAE